MDLIDELQATAELCGTNLSVLAAKVLLTEIERFPEEQVRGALSKCRRELKGRLTVAEIVARLEDGRPSADEAWAMLPWREEVTAVITTEMQEAQGLAWPVYTSGDKVAARLAFKDAYIRLVTEAREQRKPAEWVVTLGWDVTGRAGPIREAMEKGRLDSKTAARYIPLEGPRDNALLPAANSSGMTKIADVIGRKLIGS